jgi:hypothetical protein
MARKNYTVEQIIVELLTRVSPLLPRVSSGWVQTFLLFITIDIFNRFSQ